MLFCNAFSSKVIIYRLSCYIIVSAVLCSGYNQSLGFVEPISPDGLETHDCQDGGAGWEIGISSFREAGIFYLHRNLLQCKLIFCLYFLVDLLNCNLGIILTTAGKAIHEANVS